MHMWCEHSKETNPTMEISLQEETSKEEGAYLGGESTWDGAD